MFIDARCVVTIWLKSAVFSADVLLNFALHILVNFCEEDYYHIYLICIVVTVKVILYCLIIKRVLITCACLICSLSVILK